MSEPRIEIIDEILLVPAAGEKEVVKTVSSNFIRHLKLLDAKAPKGAKIRVSYGDLEVNPEAQDISSFPQNYQQNPVNLGKGAVLTLGVTNPTKYPIKARVRLEFIKTPTK